jgi:hypothetical protein
MAAFEETYRFILLEADAAEHKDWANLCIEQVRLACAAGVALCAFQPAVACKFWM